MTEPALRVAASGFGGSGYAIPTRPNSDGKPLRVIGVTTALRALDKPALASWAATQTAAYAVTHIDDLLSRTEEVGLKYLSYFFKRKKSDPDSFDFDPLLDAADGVRDDAASAGTLIHEWLEAHGRGEFEPDIVNNSQWEMVNEFLKWEAEHEIEYLDNEVTLFNSKYGYAGTADVSLMFDGKLMLGDWKSSRGTWDEHRSQVASLVECDVLLRQVDEDTVGAFKYVSRGVPTFWIEEKPPVWEGAMLIHVRPSDIDNSGKRMAPFCEHEFVDNLDIHFEVFKGCLTIKEAQRELKGRLKK